MTVNMGVYGLVSLAWFVGVCLADENLFEDLENLPVPEAYNSARVYRVVYIVLGLIAISFILLIVCCCCLPCCFFAKRRKRGTIHQPENGGAAGADQTGSYSMQLPPGQGQGGFPAQTQSYVPQGGQYQPQGGQYQPQGQYPPQGAQFQPQGYPAQPPPYPGPPGNESYPTKEPAFNPNAAY